MFQSCASSPYNTKSREAQAPVVPKMRIMVRRKLTVGGLIGHLASVSHYHIECVTLKFVFVEMFPHAISLWNMIPGSLLPLFNCDYRQAPKDLQAAHLHFPNKTIQRCAQFPNNSCTIAVGTKSFPAPVSNVVFSL